MIENSIKHIQNAINELNKETEAIVMDMSLSLQEKDNKMLPIVLEKKILTQAIDDLKYLQQNPPKPNQPCGISKYRND